MTATDPRTREARPARAERGRGRPSSATAFAAIYRLLLRSVATRGRVASVLALAGVVLLTAVLTRASDPFDPIHAGAGFARAMLFTILPVAVLLFATATLGDPVDDGSLVYLWLRPVPTWVTALAAWAATATITIPLVVVPLVLSTAIIDPTTDLVVSVVLAALLAVGAYGGLFVAGGLRFKRALPWGLAYILIWEGFIASAGESAARLAIRSYTGSIVARMTGLRLPRSNFTFTSSLIVPLLVTVVTVLYTSRRLAKTHVP